MITQSPLNVVLDLTEDRVEACAELLAGIRSDPGGNPLIPFGAIRNIHFARLLIVPRANRRVGSAYGPKLILATNYDGDYLEHLRDIVEASSDGLARLLEHCVGFDSRSDLDDVVAFLDRHQRKVNAFYINTIGRSVEQVDLERRLQESLQRHLDESDYASSSATDVHQALVEFAAGDADLQAALMPVPEQSAADRYLGWARVGVVALSAVALALLFLPVTIALIVVLRSHEVLNRADNQRPTDRHINELEGDENHGVHNQFSAVGTLQRGWFRAALIRTALWLLQLGSTHIFNRGKLAQVDTIHFARWVLIDGGARLHFFSNFDGSPESYQDDFIERVAFGLNLVFSNGNGWPRTHYLLFGGASDEQSLKAYYRDHQLPTDVWFVADAYRGLTAVNLANNAAIRKGLSESLQGDELRDWLQRF